MKKKIYYTFIFAKNHSSDLKKITFEQKYIYSFLALLGGGVLLLVFFFTNYLGLHVDQWRLSQLQKENKKLEQKFTHVHSQLRDLEKRVSQISDFSKKLQLITHSSPEQINKQKGFGKIHTNSAVTVLSASLPPRQNWRSLATLSKDSKDSHDPKPENLELRIENLKNKSEWVKQNAWTLYTTLMEQKEILNNTPSIMPVKGWVSSSFGYRNETIYSDHEPHFHQGVDIASQEGQPVMASADGKVVFTGYDENGYGNLVVVDHGYGLKTYYAHLSEVKTNTGKIVKRGETIASVGSTGRSTGPHLHYEIRIFNEAVNPDNYMLDQSSFFIY